MLFYVSAFLALSLPLATSARRADMSDAERARGAGLSAEAAAGAAASLPLPLGPAHPAVSLQAAGEAGAEWFVLQCLLGRAARVGGGAPERQAAKQRAIALVELIWTLEAEKHGAFGMTNDQFVKSVKEKLTWGMSRSEVNYNLKADDAWWELTTLLPEVIDEDQMAGTAGFDYHAVASKCREMAPLDKIEEFASRLLGELASGCEGGCTKNPFSSHTCRPAAEAICPEGTSCECKKHFNNWAPVVFVGSYVATLLIEAAISPKLAAIAPADPWAIAITSLVAMRYDGCLCMPHVCEYSAQLGACGLAGGGAEGPGYPSLPFLGTKCARDPHAPEEAKCYMQRCDAHDIRAQRLGRVGGGVFNCHGAFWEDFRYTPQSERFAFYDAHVNKTALA